MATVADIMTNEVAYIRDSFTLAEARKAMRELSVRHLPVVDDRGALVGILTQRGILAEVIKLVDKLGVAGLERAEAKIPVTEMMQTRFQVVTPQTDLKQAGEYFLSHKHSCLPVIDQGRLVGIVSSQDFVKLCVTLL